MKKTVIAILALAALVSCQSLKEEWQPVLSPATKPDSFVPYTPETLPNFPGAFTSIENLKAMYKSGQPKEVTGNTWIKGQVTTTDKTGNIYREIYIQDETGGIDLKLGKSSLYSEYALGQTLYVYCDGLTLGAYNGMPQLGWEADQTSTNEYETSYIDLQAIIDQHVFKGPYGDPVEPELISEAELKASISKGYNGELWGKLVTVKGAKYGNQIFALFYPNPSLPHKSGNPENRVFLSDNGTWGVNTWSCSKAGYISYLKKGVWDSAEVGSGATRYGRIDTVTPTSAGLTGKTLDSFHPYEDATYKEIMIKNASANYISHYFKFGSTDVQVRTSGYAKFADVELDPQLISGARTADITGILTIYNGAAQFTLVDEPSVSVKLN